MIEGNQYVFFIKAFYLKKCHLTKFGQNPLKDVDSKVFTGMLRGKNLTK
jgi:hypothetical protein